MLAQQQRPDEPQAPDRTARSAALWATAVAVPVTVLVGVLLFGWLTGAWSSRTASAPAAPGPVASAPSTPAVLPATPVTMAAPKLSPRAATVCRAVLAQLPPAVRDMPRRPVSEGREQNAAYGEPPLTVACGVAQPAMCASPDDKSPSCVPLDTELLTMNRVCWYTAQQGPAHTFTTMDRDIAVRVTVPDFYAQAGQWANEFSDAIASADRSKTADVPSGCGYPTG